MTRDELVERVEAALTEGMSRELDVHALAEFVVDHVRAPQPQPAMSRQEIVAQRLREI